jgi:cyclopropane-fatty-acyl-phospholipid synthase
VKHEDFSQAEKIIRELFVQAGIAIGGTAPTDIRVKDRRFYPRVLADGSLGLGEAYIDDWWECDAIGEMIVKLIRAELHHKIRLSPRVVVESVKARVLNMQRPGNAYHNIAHYDLGNELFELFLDERMVYSSAIFPTPAATLDEASAHKLAVVCRKLDLRPTDHLLEIGGGWGALAVYAARHHGCRVTTTTISREQYARALASVRAAGLEDRVTVLLRDYRELEGRYDKLASVEMVEAVGWRDFGTFFARCSDLLTPDGLMLLQAITIDDRAYRVERGNRGFVGTYVFPGGCLPSRAVIARCVDDYTDLRALGHQDITDHYVRTLAHWRRRFLDRQDAVAALGYDERFRRMWTLYLAYCQAGFRERRIRCGQLVLAKPGWRGPAARARAVMATPVRAIAPPTAVSAEGTSPSVTQPTIAATGGTA